MGWCAALGAALWMVGAIAGCDRRAERAPVTAEPAQESVATPAEPAGEEAAPEMSAGEPEAEGGWRAAVRADDDGERVLVVEGTVVAPNPGYEADLVEQPGGDAQELTLTVQMTPGEGMWMQVLAPKTVNWSGSVAEEVRVVTIQLPDGATVSVDVEE